MSVVKCCVVSALIDCLFQTALPALGDPIIGVDVTADGRYLVATCKTYLLLIDTLIGDGRYKGSLGFDRSFPADSKPIPRRLQLKPEHLAYMQTEVSFTPARFNAGVDAEEKTIVTSTGPFVITCECEASLAGMELRAETFHCFPREFQTGQTGTHGRLPDSQVSVQCGGRQLQVRNRSECCGGSRARCVHGQQEAVAKGAFTSSVPRRPGLTLCSAAHPSVAVNTNEAAEIAVGRRQQSVLSLRGLASRMSEHHLLMCINILYQLQTRLKAPIIHLMCCILIQRSRAHQAL